jgi:cytochrome c peroxidase
LPGFEADQYAFRTPPLRNVELTGPYGHDGAFLSLRDFVDHYSESALKLQNFNANQANLLEDALRSTVLANFSDILMTRDPLLTGVVFAPQTVDEVTEFMKALTDPAARNLQGVVPGRVPSGLPVDGGRGGQGDDDGE